MVNIVVLVDSEIRKAMDRGDVVISQFRSECLGSNSYDVHLGTTLAVYEGSELDARIDNPVSFFENPGEGYTLVPGRLYLGITEEYTETRGHVTFLEG